ncbi:MAG: 5'-nucleotidase C-terminal domain-containing protein [Spirochaetales bacterium]|nr:5'-nucleotidase C-terminal domain-containing protein [Spirochaetales bacterium]
MLRKKRIIAVCLLLFLSISFVFAAGVSEERISYPVKEFSPIERIPNIAEKGKTVEFSVFSTNDEHGWIFDWDFGQDSPRMYRGKPSPSGLARVSSLIKRLKKENPNSVLVSAGDSIQGTLLSYYYNFIDQDEVNPVTAVFDKMGYEIWTVGNHEVEQGEMVMKTVSNEMAVKGISVLSANAVWKSDNTKPYYLPYVVKDIAGVRVGFLGLTTPGIPMWLSDETHMEHDYLDMVKTAKKYVPILRNKENVDVLIGVFHSGMNEQYDIAKAALEGVPAPNASSLVAQAIGGGPDGIDAIITAHSHKVIDDTQNTEYTDTDSNIVNGVKFIQAANWGSMLGQLKFTVKEKKGSYVVEKIQAITHSVQDVKEDPEILAYMNEYIKGSKNYAAESVGEAENDLNFQLSLFQESEIVDLIHETQLHFSGADFSIAASFGSNGLIPEGDITVGNIAGIYIYENFLNAVALTGLQIKDYLEYSSNYFNVINESNIGDESLVNSDVRGYNYDMAQGFLYDIDLTKAPGSRIINMRNLDGSPLDMNKTYSVTLNSYRYNGGGGHLTACGAMENGLLTVETTYKSSMAMRDLMIEYLKIKKTWGEGDIEENWKLVPEDLAIRAIKDFLMDNDIDPVDTKYR